MENAKNHRILGPSFCPDHSKRIIWIQPTLQTGRGTRRAAFAAPVTIKTASSKTGWQHRGKVPPTSCHFRLTAPFPVWLGTSTSDFVGHCPHYDARTLVTLGQKTKNKSVPSTPRRWVLWHEYFAQGFGLP
jgi:hypothetical protein